MNDHDRPQPTPSDEATIRGLVSELTETLSRPARVILGIAGAPGSGKSTLAAALSARMPRGTTQVVPMDGFHLANRILDCTPLRDRKGAIDTFDVDGYLSLLRRLAACDEPCVYAPEYRRGLEEPVAASIAVARSVRLVITEGNYLLADSGSWRQVRECLDAVWYVESPEETRIPRLIRRHIAAGMAPDAARDWALGPDQSNAELIEAGRDRASRIVRLD